MDADMEEMCEDAEKTLIKHKDEKNQNIINLVKHNFEKMKFMLDCDFNLLIYGVGSKIDILNLFVQKKLQNKTVFYCNGFNDTAKSNLKSLVTKLIDYFKHDVFRD